ncbi:MAG: glycoside hydrolase family 57 protein, partial [Candidatus Omnitrophota bacterium]
MTKPLSIAFVWHMHQPYYKDTVSGEISLPWVRLHGIKDYFPMADLLRSYPKIRQTFNLVPSLIDQIEDYTAGELPKERFLELSLKAADALTGDEKKFILLNFFMANWDNMILPFPRYHELLLKRGRFVSPAILDRIIGTFKPQDFLDIQALFNLCWFDPHYRDQDADLRVLAQKGGRFTEAEKALIIGKQIDLIKRIIPTYRELQESSQIEVSVSPYYHPILPLLCNTDAAKTALPNERLPQKRFAYPEDASWQIAAAVKKYKSVFGVAPRGMWPSEGSVSEDMLPIVMEHGIRWIATDEEILLKSLRTARSAETLYMPYLLTRDGRDLNIIFRDHNLSDLIGFTYQNIPAAAAVNDFVGHLHRIREALATKEGDHLVSIILDGENAWEYYPNNGRDFLSLLYQRLSEDAADLKTTTVSDFVREHPPRAQISWLYPGSWIGGSYSTWICQEEKNLSWDHLTTARGDLLGAQKSHPELAGSKKLENAWRELYMAEGSDWNWWYGPINNSSCDEEFDRLYRKHLTNIYTMLSMAPPASLSVPIMTRSAKPLRSARGLIRPQIDGLDTTYYEWIESACYEVGTRGGTMQRAQSIISEICCGFDLKNLYVKVALKLPEILEPRKKDIKLVIVKMEPGEYRIEIPVFDTGKQLKGYI